MTEQQSLLIRIIGKQLFGLQEEKADLDKENWDALDWEALLSEAREQGVFSVVFDYVKDKMSEDDEHMKYERNSFVCTRTNIRSLHYHNKLHQLMQENDILYVILKGQASARYYPKPFLRDMGDVDFLVSREDVEPVNKLLTDMGYSKSSKSDEHEFHWAYRKDKEILELHWDIPGLPQEQIGPVINTAETVGTEKAATINHGNETAATVRKYVSDIIDRRELVESSDGVYYVPSAFHHGIVLLLHTISHISSAGVGLRHLCDWLVFENSMSERDFLVQFRKPLQEMGIWTFAQVMTRIGTLYFGCDEREWCCETDETICDAFLEDMLKGGNFGVKDMSRKSQVMLIQNKTTKKVSSGDVFHNAMVSINRRATFDFPVIRKAPILRPLAWVYVVLQYGVRVKQGKKRSVLTKEAFLEAMDRKSLYSKLKLFEK